MAILCRHVMTSGLIPGEHRREPPEVCLPADRPLPTDLPPMDDARDAGLVRLALLAVGARSTRYDTLRLRMPDNLRHANQQ